MVHDQLVVLLNIMLFNMSGSKGPIASESMLTKQRDWVSRLCTVTEDDRSVSHPRSGDSESDCDLSVKFKKQVSFQTKSGYVRLLQTLYTRPTTTQDTSYLFA